MEEFISTKLIENFFISMNNGKIEYVLIKNIGNELPYHLPKEKDVDVVVHLKDKGRYEYLMKRDGFCLFTPPYDGWEFLYGLPENQFWKIVENKMTFWVHTSFMLCCKSLMQKTWIPFNGLIQKRMWECKVWDESNKWWITDDETQFVYCLARCIFAKQKFSDVYIEKIEQLFSQIDVKVVMPLLESVFFRYSGRLLQMVKEKRYREIREDYLSFVEY